MFTQKKRGSSETCPHYLTSPNSHNLHNRCRKWSKSLDFELIATSSHMNQRNNTTQGIAASLKILSSKPGNESWGKESSVRMSTWVGGSRSRCRICVFQEMSSFSNLTIMGMGMLHSVPKMLRTCSRGWGVFGDMFLLPSNKFRQSWHRILCAH